MGIIESSSEFCFSPCRLVSFGWSDFEISYELDGIQMVVRSTVDAQQASQDELDHSFSHLTPSCAPTRFPHSSLAYITNDAPVAPQSVLIEIKTKSKKFALDFTQETYPNCSFLEL